MAHSQVAARRFKIYFDDDGLCQRSQAAAQLLLSTAMNASACNDTSALLAKKALKYRKVYDRMEGVDVNSPEFDASLFLGVVWCKTPCLKQFCEREQEGCKP